MGVKTQTRSAAVFCLTELSFEKIRRYYTVIFREWLTGKPLFGGYFNF